MTLIRDALRSDLEGIFELMNAGKKEGTLLKRSKKELRSLVRNGFVVVAYNEDALVGMAILDFYSKRLSELRSIYVSKEVRNNGVGKKLVQAIFVKAKALRIKELMTITLKENKGWFESHGFDEEVHGFKIALFRKL